MKRRIFSVLIALALCLSLLPAPALALDPEEPGGAAPAAEADPAPQAEGDPDGSEGNPWPCGADGDNVRAWLSADGTLTISGSGAMADYDFSGSDRPWHTQASSIKNVVIEDGVTSIGTSAFRECGQLASVQIHESVKTIGKLAFSSCQSLSNITLPSGLTSIEENLFTDCSALKRVTIPENVSVIKSQAFGSTGLTEVKIPSGVTTIEGFAFSDCRALLKVEIPQSVKSIKKYAFNDCTNATIYFKGTQEEWTSAGGGNSGVSTVVINPHDVTISGGGDGAEGAGLYSEGATVTVKAGTMAGKVFTGWTVDPENADLGEDFNAAQADTSFTMPGQAVTLTAKWAEAVAEVSGTGYADLQKAFDAAAQIEGGGTVYLLKDVTVDQPITMSQGDVTLWGQEKTITGTGAQVLAVTGGTLRLREVTVKSTYEGSELSPGIAISIRSGASLIFTGSSTVSAMAPNGRAISSAGTLNISGGLPS